MHSWNSISNALLFRIQRHSDHHAHSFRPYQILRRFDDAPYLPFEYLFAVNVVCIPPLWFRVVDPRVDALRDLATGKKGNKTAYDNQMELTEDDKYCRHLAFSYVAIFVVVCFYFAIFTNIFTCMPQ